ncbi:aminopeptidase P family N-terminal domain-containing protein [Neorhizobium sp. Rsf11]|uniref:Aminopeptidase P family N-terminal domain-containing protein n=2 Tax=Neorhizobium TaxID=1525371 RepID=A0ABV0LY66_9HYPH|nr:aminopeptidase P family N-terminal domain-containing protein [Neorhizobium petrolearium]MCC2612532.1 aminopeptidase P family N-terminal domain-containing protein [Neorhizobium petrolearium]WGI67657.1 aminopeptidase P family N-terminal domain-containing protein [Neorhizobium petrolearium]
MRHGLILWREDELSLSDVKARQVRLQQAIIAAGLDGVLIYTNHVRSAGVTWVSGFTPYWSDGLVLVLREGLPIFLTALSKRVGEWVKSVAPTFEVAHSPFPGKLAGERLARVGAKRLGVVELDRMPGGVVEEIASVLPVELSDATDLFTKVRGQVDGAELNLVRLTDGIAREAFKAGDAASKFAGDFTGPVERAVRLAGAEECYVAVAPDLSKDRCFIRTGKAELGRTFAVRLSVAYNGIWVRRIETFSAVSEIAARLASVSVEMDRASSAHPADGSISAFYVPDGAKLIDWHLEAPYGTRPLKIIADAEKPLAAPVPYGILTTAFTLDGETIVAARPVGIGDTWRREAAE